MNCPVCGTPLTWDSVAVLKPIGWPEYPCIACAKWLRGILYGAK